MRVMKTRILAGALVAVALTSVAHGFGPAPLAAAEHGDCAQLTQLKLAEVKITDAVAVPAANSANIALRMIMSPSHGLSACSS